MNIDRLLRVKARILAEPVEFEMDHYVSTRRDTSGEVCGTACCIGGHAAVDAGFITLRTAPLPGFSSLGYELTPAGAKVVGGMAFGSGVDGFGVFADALDLSPSEANRLFFVANWPKGFRVPFEQATGATARANIAGKRIDHFMRTEGRE